MNKKDLNLLLDWLNRKESLLNSRIEKSNKTDRVYTEYDVAMSECRLIYILKGELVSMEGSHEKN